MIPTISELNDYPSLQKWLNDYCEAAGYTCWHNYGPADLAAYLSDPVKILLVNSESGGYEGCKNVPSDEYLQWIEDRWTTPRNGSVLVTLIRDYISLLIEQQAIPPFDRSLTSKIYQNTSRLLNVMRGTIYMNARITSNDTGSMAEDKSNVLSDAQEFAVYRKKLVEILKPRIIICAGESAKDSIFLADGVFPKSALQEKDVFILEDFIVVKTRHLSRMGLSGGYEHLNQLAAECAELYLQKFRISDGSG